MPRQVDLQLQLQTHKFHAILQYCSSLQAFGRLSEKTQTRIFEVSHHPISAYLSSSSTSSNIIWISSGPECALLKRFNRNRIFQQWSLVPTETQCWNRKVHFLKPCWKKTTEPLLVFSTGSCWFRMSESEENEQVFQKHVASMWCHFLRQLLPFSRAQWGKVRVIALLQDHRQPFCRTDAALLQDSQFFFRIHQVKVTMCHPQMQSQSISPGNLCRHQMWRSAIEAGVPKRGHEAHHCFTRVCWHKPAIQVPKLFWHMASQVVLVHSVPLKNVLRDCNLGKLAVME